ncbi:hypothetical protein BHM03_00030335 [Ensete ventricosum]|nr:hypothetical protein BHM03_00030335 [Ensete ventricosum]
MASEISDCVFDHEDLPAAAGLQHDKLQDYFDNSLVIERALRKAFNVSSDEGDSSPPDAYMSLAEFVGLDQARGAVEKDVTKDNSCVPDERSRSPTQEHAPQHEAALSPLGLHQNMMAHHREFIHPTSQSERFPATAAADPPTYDFLQLPQNPLAQFHDMHELTVRSWLHAEQCKRLTIRRTDVAGAICHADMLSFLVDILRPDESQVL